jgi:hypothetical protein
MIKRKKKYHTDGTFLNSSIEIVEKDKIDTRNTQIHYRSLIWIGTDTSIKSDRVN